MVLYLKQVADPCINLFVSEGGYKEEKTLPCSERNVVCHKRTPEDQQSARKNCGANDLKQKRDFKNKIKTRFRQHRVKLEESFHKKFSSTSKYFYYNPEGQLRNDNLAFKRITPTNLLYRHATVCAHLLSSFINA